MKKIMILALKGVGLCLGLVVLVFFAGVYWPMDRVDPNPRPERLLLQGVNLVDVRTGGLLTSHSILVEDGVITAIGAGLPSEGATVVDASGRYAIPGLFDMHVHTMKAAPDLMHPLFIASGVTAVRDMGGCIGLDDAWVACAEDKRAWTEAVDIGNHVGPRYDQVTSLAVNGGNELPDGVPAELNGATAEGARARVAFDKARGIDFLKTYSTLPREGYFALAEEAAKAGMYPAGHLPFTVSASEAVASGQRSIEHAFLFIWDCYPGMQDLRDKGRFGAVFAPELRTKMIAEHDEAACEVLYGKMAEAGVAFVPTHTTRKLDAYAGDDAYRTDERLKYIQRPLRALWLDDAQGMAAQAGDANAQGYKDIFEFGIELTGRAHRRGVDVLVGTDAPDSFAFPGLGMRDEFEHLSKAGLSPLEVLQSATLKPARFLGLEGRAGELRIGARADIVLLGNNPLADVAAISDVDGVVLAGAYYDRKDLDQMLEAVENNAGSWASWPKFVWQILHSPIMLKKVGG